jgi:hypothetical protein
LFAVKIYDSFLVCLSGVDIDDGHAAAQEFADFFACTSGSALTGQSP